MIYHQSIKDGIVKFNESKQNSALLRLTVYRDIVCRGKPRQNLSKILACRVFAEARMRC